MDENEWLKSRNPSEMLDSVACSAGERKLRLFSLACCQRIEHLITQACSREALAFLQLHAAHGLARRKGIVSIRKTAQTAVSEVTRLSREDRCAWAAVHAPLVALAKSPVYAARFASLNSANALWWSAAPPGAESTYPPDPRMLEILSDQALLLRDIVGNPFRVATPAASWLDWNNGTPARIAGVMFAEGCFDQLPILSDALEDAGCDSADILNHLRSSGPHVRGCWAVDLCLGLS